MGTFKTKNNIVEWNGDAGLLLVSDGTVQNNIIRHNAVGVRHEGLPETELRHNDIYGNTDYDLEVTGAQTWIWYATWNWWGTTDPDVIDANVFDCEDDPGIGVCVTTYPFCDMPGCASSAQPASWGAIKAMYR